MRAIDQLRASLGAAALTALVGAPAAAEPLRGFQPVQATASIVFYARPDASVRSSEAQAAERFLGDVRRQLGSPNDKPVEYYRVGHRVDVAALVGHDADGHTDAAGRRIVSTTAVHRHELVHAAASALGNPGRFFHEGLAVALADEKEWRGKALDRAAKAALASSALRAFVDQFEAGPAAQAYAVAGSFVSHLIRRHGVAAVAGFFKACAGRKPQREVAFAAAFGQSLEQAESEWRAAL